MQDSCPPTRLELVRIISRLFAAFLLVWAFLEVSRFPNEVLNLVQNIQNMRLTAGNSRSSFNASYGVDYMILGIAVDIVRIVVLLMAVRWFYRCDPRAQRFFFAEVDEYIPSE
jgi:hypothetical protein